MPRGELKLPNFFLVGAPRAGTTSLYHHLDQHPEIFMSPLKETAYFSYEMRIDRIAPELQPPARQAAESTRRYLDGPVLEKRFAGIITEWEDYCRLFAGVRRERAIGEASTCYLWSKTAPARIAKYMADAKILIVLRNPIDRLFSQHLQTVHSGDMHLSFQQHVEAALADQDEETIGILHPFLEYGLYAEQVRRYRDHFPAAQIGLWLYEDTASPNFLREVFEFLGVDGGFMPDTATRHNQQQIAKLPGLSVIDRRRSVGKALRHAIPAPARSFLRKLIYRTSGSMQMTPVEHHLLVEYYRQDIRRLETLLQRDLSAWLQ
jgi:hypothetical protein